MTAEHAAKPALLLVHDPVPVGGLALFDRVAGRSISTSKAGTR
jgi:hypothetical protein